MSPTRIAVLRYHPPPMTTPCALLSLAASTCLGLPAQDFLWPGGQPNQVIASHGQAFVHAMAVPRDAAPFPLADIAKVLEPRWMLTYTRGATQHVITADGSASEVRLGGINRLVHRHRRILGTLQVGRYLVLLVQVRRGEEMMQMGRGEGAAKASTPARYSQQQQILKLIDLQDGRSCGKVPILDSDPEVQPPSIELGNGGLIRRDGGVEIYKKFYPLRRGRLLPPASWPKTPAPVQLLRITLRPQPGLDEPVLSLQRSDRGAFSRLARAFVEQGFFDLGAECGTRGRHWVEIEVEVGQRKKVLRRYRSSAMDPGWKFEMLIRAVAQKQD